MQAFSHSMMQFFQELPTCNGLPGRTPGVNQTAGRDLREREIGGTDHGACHIVAGDKIAGGKSGQQRAGCWLTTRQRELTESATENKPPMAGNSTGKGEKAG